MVKTSLYKISLQKQLKKKEAYREFLKKEASKNRVRIKRIKDALYSLDQLELDL